MEEVYTYTLDYYTITLQVPQAESFDEDGLYRARRLRISGAFYLPVFQLEGDTCIARLYKVPADLEYSQENAALYQAQEQADSSPSLP